VVLTANETRKSNTRRNNRAKKNNSMSSADRSLADHLDLVYDTLDTADALVDTLNTAQLKAWDGAGIVWPTWTPPV
jgi:hypothetical protein